MLSEPMIAVAQIVPATNAEGPGRRFALWFQGCPLRCPGCCNPEMLPFGGGTLMRVADIVAQMQQAQEQHAIDGITLLGGEPFAHASGAAALAMAAHSLDMSVMIFTGYWLEDIRQNTDTNMHVLLLYRHLSRWPLRARKCRKKRRWIGRQINACIS